MTYEVGASVSFRALHRMPVEGPEGEVHAHDYRIDVVVARESLDGDGMVIDLDRLDGELRAIGTELADRDLEAIRPADADAVTVEVFARWTHGRLEPLVHEAGGGEVSVRVYESAAAFGGYRAVVP